MKRSGTVFPTGSLVLVTMLLLLGWAVAIWADSGVPGYPEDPLRPMQTTRDILIYVQMRPAAGPPIPLISITPAGTDPQAKIKVENAIPDIVDYYFFYRRSHPYAVASPAINVWSDTIRTLNVADPSNNFFIDLTGGIGNVTNNYCYWARAVDAVDTTNRSTWLFSAPSNVVCDLDWNMVAPTGMTHWNQVTIPLYNRVTDTLGGWGERLATASLEINIWQPNSQSWANRGLKVGGIWTRGRATGTKYDRPYHVNVPSPGPYILKLWGDRMNDTCDNIVSPVGMTKLNNVMMQPAWHWFQDDSSSLFQNWGQKFYNGVASYDYGVREILEWTSGSQSWSSRSLWNGTIWGSRPGVRVYRPYMVNRTYPNIPGGGTASPVCWPPLMR